MKTVIFFLNYHPRYVAWQHQQYDVINLFANCGAMTIPINIFISDIFESGCQGLKGLRFTRGLTIHRFSVPGWTDFVCGVVSYGQLRNIITQLVDFTC